MLTLLRTRAASLALTATTILAVTIPPARADEPTLAQRLERLETRLEQAATETHAPGLAIGVVRDDEVLLLHALGHADIEAGRPATPDTRFAIGSTTKAFTATLCAMLVDDGRMAWSDPIATHLPGFTLADEDVAADVTIRDLLCHRVGLASMNALWYGTEATQRDILDAVARAELLHPFRERFNYSNISYLLAGIAAANAAGEDSWHTLLRRRILVPLDMAGATTTHAAALADPAMATGYGWDDDEETWTPNPLRKVDAVAPAGSINASAREMTRWLRFQLGEGRIGDTRLLSADTLRQTWEPQIDAFSAEYALGWIVSEWQGRRVVHHAGGIDGFSAQVALLPDENLGFVLLINRSGAALAEASRGIVFDAMLGDWDPDQPPAPAEDFARYIGDYIGNFGQFKDATFEVLVRNGRLAIDVPGQTVYELRPPDESGMRPFVLTDQIKIRFNENGRGEVHSLTLYQAGYEFELPREGVAQPADPIDRAAVRPYLGKFHFDALGVDVEILIQDDRLAIDVPGQTTYQLRDPDDEGRWVFKIKDSIWVLFNENEETGAVDSITLVQDGHESTLPRVGPAPESHLPTVDRLMADMRAARGGDAIDRLHALRITGDVRFVHLGILADIEIIAADDGRFRSVMDLGAFGRVLVITTPDRVWLDAPHSRATEPGSDVADALRHENPLRWLEDWRDVAAGVTIEKRTTFDDGPAILVRVETEGGNDLEWLIDPETSLPLARKANVRTPLGMTVPTTTRYDDYRPVAGVLIPHAVSTENPFNGRFEVRYTSVEPNAGIPPGVFDIPSD